MSETSYDGLSEVARKGLVYYDEHLKSVLEPEQNGKAIALHVDTGEYAIADTLPQARREMYRRYPDPQGRILSRLIGPTIHDSSRMRVLAGDK